MLLRLLLIVVLVLGAVWLVQNVDFDRDGGVRAEGTAERAKERVGEAVERAGDKVREAVSGIDVDEVARELKQTGRVVRRKAGKAAHELADATRDGRTTAAIKAKLALDPHVSALDVSVDTTDGRVTLAGRADSAAAVARAIEIALEEEGVYEVISTLQVQPRREGASSAGAGSS